MTQSLQAAEYRIPQARLPLLKTAPTIDGTVDEKEWAGAARMVGFGWGPLLKPQEASFWVGCDGKELFIAVVSETPPGGKIISRVNPSPADGDARVWLDDSIEMVLDPLRTDTSGRRRFYHAIINAKGAIYDASHMPTGGGEAWRGNWRVASKVVGDRWHFELALPLKDMKVTDADLFKPWGIRICRNWKQTSGREQTEWSVVPGAFLQPETMPVVTWDPAAPVVQTLQLHDDGKANLHIRVAITNPTDKPLDVQASFKCVPKSSAPKEESNALTVPPGQTVVAEIIASALNEEVATTIQVASKDSQTIWYLRDFAVNPVRPENLWVLEEEAAKKVETSFAYYPYHNKVMLRVDYNSLADKAKVTGIAARIQRKSGEAIASTNFTARVEWPLPALGEGEYECVVELQGVKTDAIKVPFVRHVFPWEHNSLGKSDVVLPPFTPIKVAGRTVSTVLRKHTLDDLGLWKQVESLDKPLLKKPMRLELNQRPIKGGSLKFTERKDTRAVADSKWPGGTTRCEWDYDGLMKWTLELQPSAKPVESLTLVIPLDDKLCPLFHACTDGIRFNVAGATPKGTGRVWDGSKAARNSIIGSYVPYIWLGAEERGLAVFGENDRGWATDPKVPCQEIVRNGDTLELRLNLIAKPTTIAEPRRIVIGFQATPVKPLPDNWRLWTFMAPDPTPDGRGRPINFLGSCWTWGALTPCLDVYPHSEDFRIWDEFKKARESGIRPTEFIDQWIEGKAKSDEERKRMRPEINAAFHVLCGKPKDIISYTNARGVRFDTPEGQTFLNEWHRDAFPQRKWGYGDGVAYDLNPSESFRDYATWYYQKMYDQFTDGIYWDDIFLQSCFHTVDTDAYEMPDGNIQPAGGLWDMRELIRRTAVLAHERGKKLCNMVHMTNTGLVPIIAFSQTIYTWEDKAGDLDFQDRFTRDYIRAESTGRQYGAVPFTLYLFNGSDTNKIAWAKRTGAGVLMVHELKTSSWAKDWWDNYKRLADFGYGKPEVKVFNYWNANNPATVTGTDAATLVLSKPDAALVVVCDYGNGGNLTLNLDRKALALPKQIKASDLETGKPLDVADGAVRFELKKHDFKMILVEAEK